jgi:hypothetical protein
MSLNLYTLEPARRMKMMIASLLLFSNLISIRTHGATPELVELREQTKAILNQRHCFNCHSPEGKRPLERAMKIYNLASNQWFNTMTDRQLLEFKGRILDKMSPEELKEMGGDPKEKPLDNKQIAIVSRFIQREISNRKENPLEKVLTQVNQ